MASEYLRSKELEQSSRARPAKDGSAAPATLHPLLRLQQAAGNGAVARMLQRAADEEEKEGGEAESEAGDEAKDAGESEGSGSEEEEKLQRKAESPEVGLAGGPLSQQLAGRINGARGQGATLDAGLRGGMEGAFGTGFGDVRVHRDSESDTLNRSISAKAFTTGSDIFLRGDQDTGDRSLLAHELTHVVQQRSGGGGPGPMEVGPAGDASEREADSVADAVLSRMSEREDDRRA